MILVDGKIIVVNDKKYRVRGAVNFFVWEQEENVFDVWLDSVYLDERLNEWKSHYSVKLTNFKDFAIWQVDNYERRAWVKFLFKELKITKISDREIKKDFDLYFCSYYNDKNSFVLILQRNANCYTVKDLTYEFRYGGLLWKEIELKVECDEFKDIIFSVVVKVEGLMFD